MSGPSNSNNNGINNFPPKPEPADRMESVDSAAFFEGGDDYDDYDDFGVNQQSGGGGGGGGGSSKTNEKMDKRQENRGGGGSGTIYSAKHVRAKESLQKSKNVATSNKGGK